MTAKETRAQAREALTGQWGKTILFLIIYSIITAVISLVLKFIPFIGSAIELIISIPLSIGLTATFMKIKRKEQFEYFDFINTSIEMFGKSWGIVGHIIVKMLIPVILLIISIVIISAGFIMLAAKEAGPVNIGAVLIITVGIILYIVSIIWTMIKGYLYAITSQLLIDNENMTTLDIVEKSETLMNGNRMKFFFLNLSFIGWAILASFTFGIGLLWLIPYIAISGICFYDNIANDSKNIEVEEISE